MGTVLVIGSGIAGLVAALKLSATHEVTLVTKAELTESNTLYAQGGIAAVVSGTEGDSAEAHTLDTLRAGAGLNDAAAVQTLCTEGPALVRELIDVGVPFDRSGGSLARGLEAAHSHARVLHAGGDATGAAIERTLVAEARSSTCRIVEHAFLADLVVDDGCVIGADIITDAGQTHRLDADAVVIATGGAGQLYQHTTNPTVTTGDGIAAAWRAGAELADVEFFQFHPTALAIPGSFLVSEAVRGEGAVLINESGERFMTDVHPDAELAPRDVVARAIAVEMAAQNGVPVRLDATSLGAEFLARRFPTIEAATRAAGRDWGREAIPVTPAAHYWMGGIATDLWGRTTLPGLYAIGEAACTAVHGANRLASNSLLEGLVFADRAARDIVATGGRVARWSLEDREAIRDPSAERACERGWRGTSAAYRDQVAGYRDARSSGGDQRRVATVDRAELQRLMWDAAGVLRSRDCLERAAVALAAWSSADLSRMNIAQREDANLLDLARVLVAAALAREESRGAHYRSDFPHASPDFARQQRWTRRSSMHELHEQEAFAC